MKTREAGGIEPMNYTGQILNSLTSGVIAVDGQGVVLVSNTAAGEHLQVPMERLAPGCRLDAMPHVRPFLDIERELFAHRIPISRREIILEYEDGGRKEIGLSASLLEGPREYNGVIFLFVDMTERRRQERAAELTQQLATIGELTAGVVHELRNPISVIRGMGEFLLRKLPPEDDRRKSAKIIFDEAVHMEKSIAQFLSFARPFELEPVHCSHEDVVNRVIQLCRRQADVKSVTLDYEAEADIPSFRGDPGRLAQALANIVGNAVDAVDTGGRVTLRVTCRRPHIVFEIIDNGPGIHLEPGEDLFQPFFTRKEDGTGLGLAIVHRIVTSHHGKVSYGNHEGGGARFEVRIPIDTGSAW